MIKESWDLTEWEAHLATTNQSWQTLVLPSLQGYQIYSKSAANLRYWLLPCRVIGDQKIMQSNWRRGTTGHTQTKVVVSDANFKNLRY